MKKEISLYLLAAFFCFAGVMHFVNPSLFLKAVPSYLPEPMALVLISGFFEVLGAIGVLVPRTRKAAGIGLIALLIAVFPANIHMALHPQQFKEIPLYVLYLRLPLQLLLIYWVKRATG